MKECWLVLVTSATFFLQWRQSSLSPSDLSSRSIPFRSIPGATQELFIIEIAFLGPTELNQLGS